MRAQRYLWHSFLLKLQILQELLSRITVLLPWFEAKQRKNWIACAWKLDKRKRWELICDEVWHCGASSAHTVSLARLSLSDRCSESAKRHGMSVQKRQDKQKDKGVVYWQSRQTPVRTMYTIADRSSVGSYRRQNFILALRVISTFYRLPSTMSRRARN